MTGLQKPFLSHLAFIQAPSTCRRRKKYSEPRQKRLSKSLIQAPRRTHCIYSPNLFIPLNLSTHRPPSHSPAPYLQHSTNSSIQSSLHAMEIYITRNISTLPVNQMPPLLTAPFPEHQISVPTPGFMENQVTLSLLTTQAFHHMARR